MDQVHKGNGPIAITQRSKIKAVLVDANWHDRVEEELSSYRRSARSKLFKLGGTMELTGDLEQALEELKREREASLETSIERSK